MKLTNNIVQYTPHNIKMTPLKLIYRLIVQIKLIDIILAHLGTN